MHPFTFMASSKQYSPCQKGRTLRPNTEVFLQKLWLGKTQILARVIGIIKESVGNHAFFNNNEATKILKKL